MKYKCDIILLSYESPELLEKCVKSVMEHTRISSRLIVVDNASRHPGVKAFLGGLRGNDTITVEKIFSEENAGFAAGMNKGMKLSDAPFLCILNNDCVVADGWLEEMIAVAESADEIGLVNPQSNTFGSSFDGGASVNEHAALLADKKGSFVELGHAIGFACLIKREVIEEIGYLDEVYEGVCYEDTDFSIRAQKAGFISVMAEAAYVFHLEQASRRTLKGKKEIYRRNKEIFEEKWGPLLRVLYMDDSYDDIEKVPERYGVLRNMARQRTIIDMWVRPGRFGTAGGNISKDIHSVKHADVNLTFFSGKFMDLAILWKVLTKKKRFNAVMLPDCFLLRVLRFLKPIHTAEVLSIKEKGQLSTSKGAVFDLADAGVFAEWLRSR